MTSGRQLLQSRRGSAVAIGLVLVAIVGVAAIGWVALTNIVDGLGGGTGSDGRSYLKERLHQIVVDVGDEPTEAPGARLVDRFEYDGDLNSDGPSVEWRYAFGGNASDFLAHYRAVLPGDGWSESPRGNLPGQLANFVKTVDGRHYLLSVFGPPGTGTVYSVSVRPTSPQ